MLQLGCMLLVILSLGFSWLCYTIDNIDVEPHKEHSPTETTPFISLGNESNDTLETQPVTTILYGNDTRNYHHTDQEIKNEILIGDDEDNNSDDLKTRILITGIGHSATSYLEQFIGDVIYRKRDIFYLFESTHPTDIRYAKSFYNITTTKFSVETRRKLLSFYFECNFHPNMQYDRAWRHFSMIKKMNKWHHDEGVNGNMLRHKCLASKTLIYKEIHMPQYSEYFWYLWQQFPKLKIIAMVRNPLTHVPSSRRMVKLMPFNDEINHICYEQLHEIRYGLNHSYDAFGVQRFYVFKLEEFFHNITHELNTTVKYYYQNVLDIRWNASDEAHTLQRSNHYYSKMLRHLWGFNHRQPLSKGQELTSNQTQRIIHSCRDFNALFGY